MTGYLTWTTKVAKKNPWKPLRMSIMRNLSQYALMWILKVLGERIANEILMHFRAGRKSAQDVSLSDFLDTGSDGAPLALMDVISEDVDLVEQVGNRETIRQLRAAVDSCLTEQERTVIRLRYGLDNDTPLRQREVADRTGLSRSYISRIEKRALGKLKAALA